MPSRILVQDSMIDLIASPNSNLLMDTQLYYPGRVSLPSFAEAAIPGGHRVSLLNQKACTMPHPTMRHSLNVTGERPIRSLFV